SQSLGLTMVRAATVGTHPLFVEMLVELIEERLKSGSQRSAVGRFGPDHDICPADCCPAPRRPVGPPNRSTNGPRDIEKASARGAGFHRSPQAVFWSHPFSS